MLGVSVSYCGRSLSGVVHRQLFDVYTLEATFCNPILMKLGQDVLLVNTYLGQMRIWVMLDEN